MKLITVWKIFPAVIINSKPNISASGTTNGFLIRLKEQKPEDMALTLSHELIHVKQFYVLALYILGCMTLASVFSTWYLTLIIPAVLWWISSYAIFIRESAAYAESARCYVARGENENVIINKLAAVLDNSSLYSENKTFDEIKAQIYKRYKDKHIF